MLEEGRLPMSVSEEKVVDDLIAKYPDANISLTRRDPGDTGPLLAHVDNDTHEVTE